MSISTTSYSRSSSMHMSTTKKRNSSIVTTSSISQPYSRAPNKKARLNASKASSTNVADHESCKDVTAVRVRTLGEMLHDRSLSVQRFSRIIRTKAVVTLKPMSHIWDCGDVSSETFLAKWSSLLPTVSASAREAVLLRLVNQESLVLESEFNKHKSMLRELLAATCDSKVLKRGVLAAADIGSSDVAFALLRRLRELAPSTAAQLEGTITLKLSRSSLALQDQLDEEQDARLAALEDEPNSDDEDFIVDDSDNESSQDGNYEPQSESASEENSDIASDEE